MFAALIFALAITGQQAAGPSIYSGTDSDGHNWHSADRDQLERWMAPGNAKARADHWAKVHQARPSPEPAVVVRPAFRNYGIDLQKMREERHSGEWYGGNTDAPVGPEPSAGKARRLHLTVIAPDLKRAEAVVAAWEADPEFKQLEAAMGDKLVVRSYAADDVMVAGVGLPAGGQPDVVLQFDSGKVVFRAKCDPGAAVVAGEIRKRDPNYDPSKDPGGGGPEFSRYGWAVVAFLALVLTLSILRRDP